MTGQLNQLETAVLDKILAGDHPVLMQLREQRNNIAAVERELTGVGFFSRVQLSPGTPRLEGPGSFALADIVAEISGLAHGAGFVIFVKDGYLNMLEGFSFDEPWPAEITAFSLRYDKEPRDLSCLNMT